MKKKDQEAISKLYTEAAAFYGGGQSSKDDPLGLGDIRMAEPGENPYDDDDDDVEDDSFNDVTDCVLSVLSVLERTMRKEDINHLLMTITDPKNSEEVRHLINQELSGGPPQYYDDDQY